MSRLNNSSPRALGLHVHPAQVLRPREIDMDAREHVADTRSERSRRRGKPTAVACYPCRHSKLKCDGARPICRTCDRRSKDCVYDPKKDKHQSLLERFHEAQERIKELEDSNETLRQGFGTLALNSSLPSEVDQQQVITSCFTFEDASVSTTGWLELSQIFRIHYASDLSFVHVPSLVGPYFSTAGLPLDKFIVDQTLDSTRALSSNPSGLMLAFLALTLRHRSDEDCLETGEKSVGKSAALSSHFATLAKHWLFAHGSTRSCADVEGVQVRLMLALYDWSIGRAARARQLLSEAISIANDLGFHCGYSAESGRSAVSVAMAFEAESMGMSIETLGRANSFRADGIDEELARRLSWSCFLMDTQYSLGGRRPKIIRKTAGFPPLPGDHTAFKIGAEAGDLLDGALPNDGQRKCSTTSSQSWSTLRSTSSDPMSMFGECASAQVPLRNSPENDPSHARTGSMLSHYIRFASLLYCIHTWSESRPWQSEKHPPWTRACSWNTLLRQWLTINKDLPDQRRLSKSNTILHAEEATSAHYFNMHIARLLCQIFLHWEFLPFLPLRYTQAEGRKYSRSFFRQTHEAPPGFWKSSARQCFSAARSILNLVADAREAGSLATNSFALYGIFIAKFVEVYAKAFPWMNPDYVPMEYFINMDVNDKPWPTCLSARPPASYATEIGGAHTFMHIAEEWVTTLDSITIYFETFKRDYNNSLSLNRSRGHDTENDSIQVRKCLRDGGAGDGCEEYELFRHRLSDFGKF